jgi:hypothetical protein
MILHFENLSSRKQSQNAADAAENTAFPLLF